MNACGLVRKAALLLLLARSNASTIRIGFMGMSHEAGPAPAIYPFSRRELTRRPPRSITGPYNDPADPGSSICPTCAAAFVAAVETLNERSAELLGGHVIEGGESRGERRKHIHLLPQFKQVASNPPQTVHPRPPGRSDARLE